MGFLMSVKFSKILVFFMLMILTTLASCGAKINKADSRMETTSEMSYLLLEKNCSSKSIPLESISLQIEETHRSFREKYPMAFIFIPPKIYDYKDPLIVSVASLEKRLGEFKKQEANIEYLQANLTNMGIEIHHLYQQTMRFEGQKCEFSQLKHKKYQDLRPFLELKEFCQEKNSSEFCTPETVSALTLPEGSFVESRTVKLCNTFDKNVVNCKGQYELKKQTKTLGDVVGYYQKRFHKERFLPLFQLKKSHLKFQCEKQGEKTIMKMKVSSRDWDQESLLTFTNYVSTVWSRGNFQLTINLVNETGSDVVKITPTQEFISYVPEDNHAQVYLSQNLDLTTQRRVLSHEFGHVLGFPDCYTEFFDNKSGELVYYEMDKNNTNLMCSLKEGVSVPDDYLDQLIQKSCIFN